MDPAPTITPVLLTENDGIPIRYPDSDGLGLRVIHPSNPRAPSRNVSATVFRLPPGTELAPRSHEPEEIYFISAGQGLIISYHSQQKVTQGDFVYLPARCEHGIRNTGSETLVVLITTSPPNP
jgi:mannose-6-phosphate isomerase-like protein (cupin superfamily)